jgi:hypothetical protein
MRATDANTTPGAGTRIARADGARRARQHLGQGQLLAAAGFKYAGQRLVPQRQCDTQRRQVVGMHRLAQSGRTGRNPCVAAPRRSPCIRREAVVHAGTPDQGRAQDGAGDPVRRRELGQTPLGHEQPLRDIALLHRRRRLLVQHAHRAQRHDTLQRTRP